MPFTRNQGRLHANSTPLKDIVAKVGTPCYVYNWDDIQGNYESLDVVLDGIDARICYAVKANSNLTILKKMASIGAGFDIVSGGELERVLYAGGDPSQVVFSGVGKSKEEISFALKVGIGHFNVESHSEVSRIEEVASRLGLMARLVVRVNPDISVDTHPYITTGLRENKFGLVEEEALRLAAQIHSDLEYCEFLGIASHIGSQLGDLAPYEAALDFMLSMRQKLADQAIPCHTIDIGGGFGIRYNEEQALSFSELGAMLRSKPIADIQIELEPGRSLVAGAGVLLTHVEYLKESQGDGYRNFCVVNAAMNDLIRPALYGAYHRIENVEPTSEAEKTWQVVGPICETGDFLANERTLSVSENDLLAIFDAGAYGFTLSSNYNSRPRVPEVLVVGDSFEVIRRRESVHDLIHLEQPLP